MSASNVRSGLAFGIFVLQLTAYAACAPDDGTRLADPPAVDSSWVDPEPLIEIGSGQAGEEYEFRTIGSVFPTADGRLAVVDRGNNVIRLYDSGTGTHVRTLGRSGGGPDEFLALYAAWPTTGRDTLLSWDVLGMRIGLWRSDGVFIESVSLAVPFQPIPLGAFHDRSILAVHKENQSRMRPGTVQSLDGTLYRIVPGTDSVLQLDALPWEVVAAGVDSRGGEGSLYVPQPFSAGASVAVGDTVFYYTDGSTPEIRVYDWFGRMRETWKTDAADAAARVTGDERSRWIDDAVAQTPSELRAGVRRFLESLVIAETHPVWRSLLIDTGGRLWAERFTNRPDSASVWWVFTRDGDTHGPGLLPPRFTPMHIGDDDMLGRRRNELNVETVVRLRITNDPRR